ncbi:HepT-like ribonuclease domain-containing protein [uncultured Clostridium sp.]|uniref:HepT-like ribonuclease domain-containing protein n=1 Tax=uncultured Clostridium sp. TaxID=59620 RepID=UPI0028E45F42|nr:HepT-like ribonuclease domain-containing protein [uncultured Clostridium sp.]
MMNRERLYDIIKNIRETLSLLDKALIKLEVIDDEDIKELIKSSVKQSFLEYFILIESFTSLCLKELKLYRISDDMEKSLKKLYENNIISEEIYIFLNQYRRYRNRIAHVYKQPSVEEVIEFVKDNKNNINEVINIITEIYKK